MVAADSYTGPSGVSSTTDRSREFVILDEDIAILQKRICVFSATHGYRGAFEVFDKFNESMSFDAPGVRVIVTKTLRGNTEAESAIGR
jgi:hypothetical protein